MAAGQGLDIPTIAETVLAGIEAHYNAAAGVTLPDRRVIAGGNPRLVAWDACEQLVVTCSGIGIGHAEGQGAGPKSAGAQISAAGMRHTVIVVQLTRCNPESKDGTRPPASAVQTAAALAYMRDMGLMSQALVEVTKQLNDSFPGLRVQPGAVESLGPAGGFVCCEGKVIVTAGALV